MALSQVNNKLEQPSILTVSSSRSDQLFRTKAEPGLHLYIIKDKISNWVKCGGTNSGCVPERLNSVSPDQLFSLKYFALFPSHNFFNFYSLDGYRNKLTKTIKVLFDYYHRFYKKSGNQKPKKL